MLFTECYSKYCSFFGNIKILQKFKWYHPQQSNCIQVPSFWCVENHVLLLTGSIAATMLRIKHTIAANYYYSDVITSAHADPKPTYDNACYYTITASLFLDKLHDDSASITKSCIVNLQPYPSISQKQYKLAPKLL